jgi:predicted nucleic-acid-binding Zn-ribbon protein
MPIECDQLRNKEHIERCPKCRKYLREPLMRGQVQSWFRKVLRMKYCAVICNNCKEVIGWERP